MQTQNTNFTKINERKYTQNEQNKTRVRLKPQAVLCVVALISVLLRTLENHKKDNIAIVQKSTC